MHVLLKYCTVQERETGVDMIEIFYQKQVNS